MMKRSFAFAFAVFAAAAIQAAPSTYCNPMPLPKIPLSKCCSPLKAGDEAKMQFRELADPSLLIENGVLYVYPSVSMAWKSEDMGATWKKLEIGIDDIGYAPTVVKHRGKYFITAGCRDLYVSDSPEGLFVKKGKIEGPQSGAPGTSDAMLFSDDDGRLYFYFGCSPRDGIWGMELDPENPLKRISDAKLLIPFEPETQSWECKPNKPSESWIEGAWMVKIAGRYCLTYSSSGTENSTYAMGAAWSDRPLGEFRKQKNNPFFRKTKGVVRGTAHGAVEPVPGRKDEFFVTYSILVGAMHGFERLIGIDRVGIDANGELAVREATETPQWVDGSGPAPWYPMPFTSEGHPEATDDRLDTWSAMAPELPATMEFVSKNRSYVRAYRLVWRDLGVNELKGTKFGPYRYRIEVKDRDDKEWKTLVDATANDVDLMVDYRETPRIRAESLRLTVTEAPKGVTAAVAELTVFGE